MSTEFAAKTTGFTLNADEVLRLLNNTDTALQDVAGKIAGVYATDSLKSTDSAAAEQIFRLLMREAEVRVRATLSAQMKSSAILPKDIALAMARDVEEVALPMLQHSTVLTEGDLLELVNGTHDLTRYLAIARRENVPEKVAEQLVFRGNDTIASALVDNPGAELSQRGLENIIARYPANGTLMESVAARPQLPLSITEKLIAVVTAELADTLKQKYYAGAPKEIERHIEQEADTTRENETLRLIVNTHTQEELNRLTNQLMSFHRLTPSLILSALSQGNATFFETALARLSNIPVANARTLINDRGDLGFRAIYNKSNLPEPLFPAVRLLLKTVHQLEDEGQKNGTAGYTNALAQRFLQRCETEGADNAAYMIALIRKAL